MTAQDLKNAILQLAVQGKLVPQDSDEEPATELFNRIKLEKEKLFRSGRISIDKKHTPSPISEDDIAYDLPDSWCWVRFADIASFYSGKTPERHTSEYWNNGNVTWVSIADMVSDGITVETKEKVSQHALDDCFSGKMTPAGTMIMSFKLTIGKISILGVDAVHNEAIISIFPFIDEEPFKSYLFKVLPLISNGGDSKNAVKGKTLNATSISNLMIPLPPLAEQQRIVAKIEELMPLIEEYGKAEEQLTALNTEFPEKLRRSIVQQAIQGKLTERDPADEPAAELLKRIRAEKEKLIKEGKIKKEKPLPPITEDEIPFEIPKNWIWVRLQELADTIVDCPHSTPVYLEEKTGYHAIGTKCMNGKGEITHLFNVDEETYRKRIERLEPQKNDIVYSREGSIVCRAVILPDNTRICLGQRVMLIRCPKGVLQRYMQLYLMADQTVTYLTQNYKGAAAKHINVADVCRLPVPLPPIAEQQRFVVRVNELLDMCDELKGCYE